MDKETAISVLKQIPDYGIDMLSIVCPPVAAAYRTAGFKKSASETIFLQKLLRVLIDQDSDFNDWLKIAEKFDSDNSAYEKTVRQLIYSIEAINEIDLLDVYANLLRAWKAGLLEKAEFFRLGWILTRAFSSDLMYLKECYGKKDMDENQELLSLERYNLVYKRVIPLMNGAVNNVYTITPLGIKMLSRGIDYEHYSEYK